MGGSKYNENLIMKLTYSNFNPSTLRVTLLVSSRKEISGIRRRSSWIKLFESFHLLLVSDSFLRGYLKEQAHTHSSYVDLKAIPKRKSGYDRLFFESD